jgi:hypothetical protein
VQHDNRTARPLTRDNRLERHTDQGTRNSAHMGYVPTQKSELQQHIDTQGLHYTCETDPAEVTHRWPRNINTIREEE